MGFEVGAIGHLPNDRGIHFNDKGRLLLAQLVLNALALRMAAPGAHLSPASRTNGHTHSRRSRLKHVQRRGRWPNATSVARRGYCEVTSRKGDCRRDDKGYWTGVADLAQCAERCRGCANCRYVSFSWAHDECAWFTHCRLPLEQKYQGDTYQTLKVRGYLSPTSS